MMFQGSSYSGGFTLGTSGSVGGTFIARSNNAFSTGAITINSGTIGGIQNFTSPGRSGITVGGDFTVGATGTIGGSTLEGHSVSFNTPGNTVNLTGGTRAITLNTSGVVSFGQAVSSGSLILNRTASGSAGAFALSGTNTFSALTLDSVKLNVTSSNFALGSGTVTLQGANATTLNFSDGRIFANTFTIADSAGAKTIATNANSTINGTITNNDSTGGLVLGGTSTRTLTIGSITGNGSRGVTFGSSVLTGTVTLTGSSNYAGATRIDSSTLRITGTGAVPAGGNLVFQGSGTATFDVNGTTQTVAGLNDSVLAGAIRSTAANGKLIVGDSNDSTFRGVMSTANLALEKVGSGKLTLSGSNTYSGTTTLTAGTLALGSANAIGSSGTISFGGGTLQSSASNTADYSARFSNAANQQVKIDTNGQSVTLAANLTSSGGSFTKLGAGTVTLSGSNTYSGATTVSAGTLLVNASLTNSAVTVGNGGTLGGNGTLGSLVTVQSGGVLSPGNSPGALAAAALDLQAGSTTLMQVIGSGSSAGVAGTDYDQVRITTSGGLTYGGSLDLDFASSTKFLNGTVFDLFAFTGASIGDFSSVFTTGTGLYSGYSLSGAGGIWTTTIGDQLLSFSELTGRLTISAGAVPEIDPAMGANALSLVAGVLAMLEQRRRRTAKATLSA